MIAQMCFMKKVVSRNFAKFTRKYLCQSLFLLKLQPLGLLIALFNSIAHRHTDTDTLWSPKTVRRVLGYTTAVIV